MPLLSFFCFFNRPLLGFFAHDYFCCLLSSRLELFNATGRVDELFFPCVERMTGVANFNLNLLLGRSYVERIAARAGNLCFGEIFWMYIFFHIILFGEVDACPVVMRSIYYRGLFSRC